MYTYEECQSHLSFTPHRPTKKSTGKKRSETRIIIYTLNTLKKKTMMRMTRAVLAGVPDKRCQLVGSSRLIRKGI